MKLLKNFYCKKVLSFLLVFTLIFSQNSMIVFANMLNKIIVNVDDNLEKDSNNKNNKSNQNNDKNSSNITQGEFLSKENSNEYEFKKEDTIENNLDNNSIEFEKMKSGSYIVNQNIIYPFTGDWGAEYTFESDKQISTYENTEKGYYYIQLDERKKLAYKIYIDLLKTSDQNHFFNIYEYKLYAKDFYGIYTAAIHEHTELFYGLDMVLDIDDAGIVRNIKYETPFTQEELNSMKIKFNEAIEKALKEIRSGLRENSNKFEILKRIHDYLVKNNHYGSATCSEQTHSDKIGHLGCKWTFIEHSAYGALVKNENYGVVCEGFASAFILLCKYFNIDALYDSGVNSQGNDLHAWNYVQMEDQKWYLVDLTFDNLCMEKYGLVYVLFLTSIENPNFDHTHNKYLGCYLNYQNKSQEYDIPDISENSYVKFEVNYQKESQVIRNIFPNFRELLDDLKEKNLPGSYKIILKDNYTITENEVNKLKDYTTDSKQNFCINSEIEKKGSTKRYSLKSSTNKIYFPMNVYLYDITYEIESTYIIGNNIVVGKNLSNGSCRCSIYLLGKNYNTKTNVANISSGHWENIVGAYSDLQYIGQTTHNGNVKIIIQDTNVDTLTLSQGSTILGSINVEISKNSRIGNFKYGNGINLDRDKIININISTSTVETFDQNTEPISASVNINVENGIVKKLIGPILYNGNFKCITTMNILNSQIDNIIGSDNSNNANNDVVININRNNSLSVKSIKGSTSKSVNSTININDNIDLQTITDFDRLVIGIGNKFNISEEFDYNKSNSNKKGIVEFNGNSTLKLPRVISKVGSLISIGESNKLIISQEDAYLSINEKQGPQGTAIIMEYDEYAYPKNGDELVRYKYIDDIHLNNFINGINTRFQLYNDDSTFSIRLFLSGYPVKVKCKYGQYYEFSCLCDALDYVKRQSSENFKEVEFNMNENYEMNEEDLTKLRFYSSELTNQKLVFTSENISSVLSTSSDVILPTSSNQVLEIEFKNVTLDFDNRDIFAAGTHLIMGENVNVTPLSNINIYGGLPGTRVMNSRLTLNSGTFNNIYGGGSLFNGIVSKNVDICLNKNVLIKGNVYGGADYDQTGLNQAQGITTINLLGGTVLGDIIGGGENDQSNMFNKIVINYEGTNVNNIYGLSQQYLSHAIAHNDIEININKNANLRTVAGFNNLNINHGVGLYVSYILKYDEGISNNLYGRVRLFGESSLYIPNTGIEEYRKIGQLESIGLNNNIYIAKNNYLLINSNTNAVTGNPINLEYYNGTPMLNDNIVKFSNCSLTSSEKFKTNYHFNISANPTTGFLYFSQKTYKVQLYTYKNPDILYRVDEVNENSQYTFEEPPKLEGKRFTRWKNIDEVNVYYNAGETINVNKDISVLAEYDDVEEYSVTLEVDGIPYRTDYVEAWDTYTFPDAPPKPEKYFIGWDDEDLLLNNFGYRSSVSMIKSVGYIQPGKTITVNRDLIFNATYKDAVKYDVDYGNENGKIQNVYYDGGIINVPTKPPVDIKIPFGKIFAGFRVIFSSIGNIVGGIANTIFKPGQSITIHPGMKIEAVWVDELTINLYDENGKIDKTEKVGKGFEYTLPTAKQKSYKDFKYWKNTSNPNEIYKQNENIVVNSNLNLRAVYKNNKIVSVSLDSNEPKYFSDFSLALNYAAENSNVKVVNIEFLEDYAFTDPDIDTLMNFNKNNVNLIIKGCNKNIELRMEKSINLSTDTTFENIVFKYVSSNNNKIYARGNRLEMGPNITMEGTVYPVLLGGDDKKDVNNSEIIVKSGTYSGIYGGGYSEYSGINGDVTIELYDGKVIGDIYAGSQNTGLISGGTTNIKLAGGSVGGVVSGASRLLSLDNSNDVNIHLQGTKLNEVYGGYVKSITDSYDTGFTTIYIEKEYTLNKLIGFSKLYINTNVTLTVKEILNNQGGISKNSNSGEICLNGNSKLVVPSSDNDLDRQAGWLSSTGENNEIRVDKNKYLNLTSERDDITDASPITLSLKEEQTSKEESILLKYENKKEKANSTKFKKGTNIQTELVLKVDKEKGTVYTDEKDLISIIKQGEKTREFKTIQDAIKNVQSDNQEGTYTLRLLDDYKLTESDINTLSSFNRSGVSFVIDGLTENDKPNAMLNISNDIMLSTDTTFENIYLNYNTSDTHGIYARGHRLEMGESIAMKGLRAPILFGGENRKNVKSSNIIVKSGTYSGIYGGGSSEYSGVEGDITIELQNGTVTGDIYAGSQNTGLISKGTTNIKLIGGSVSGIVSGTSKLLELENSNNVNIYLKGTSLNKVYGGYVKNTEDYDDTGITTVTVEKTCTLKELVGFTNLEIAKDITLEVTNALNHKGGVRVTKDSGKVSLNGNSKLVVPSTDDVSKRQVGWLKSEGQGNEIVVDTGNKYLNLTSKKDDEIKNDSKIILNIKENQTSKESSILLKYENKKEKANTTKFENSKNIQGELVLKCNKLDGSVYIGGKDLIKITKPRKESIGFKTIKDAIENIELDNEVGTYTVTLLENYTLSNLDINALSCFNRPNVDFVISGLNENTHLREVLKINNNIMLSTDTEFENIILDYETNNCNEIYARGHKLEMGENITVEGICYPILFGGENGKNVKHSEIIVKSGTYEAIYGGGSSEYSGVEGNITIELDNGVVRNDIYAGSENMGLTCGGKTEIILAGGTVGGVVSGTSKLLGLENSNNVNIQLQGTELNELYGGYVEYGKDYDNTGITIVTVGKTCTLKDLVGFTRLNVQPEVVLTVTDVLNYEGGVSVVGDRAQINLNRNAELIDPSKYNASKIKSVF